MDGYVVWAKANGFPWWPAQLVTLEGMDPTAMRNVVKVWSRDANSGGPGGRPAPLAWHRFRTHFLLNSHGIL